MRMCHTIDRVRAVALRKESVDRNVMSSYGSFILCLSLSARRAWIEIASGINPDQSGKVALRKESVDRNLMASGSS